MNRRNAHQAALLRGTSFVPATLQPAGALAMPAQKIGFFRGFLGFWIMPNRLGPHLAAMPLRRALIAHVLAILLAIIVMYLLWLVSRERVSISIFNPADVRAAIANNVVLAATGRWSSQSDGLWIVSSTVAMPAIDLFLLVFSIANAPFAACGKGVFSAWLRSLKMTLWASSALVPVSFFAVLSTAYYQYIEVTPDTWLHAIQTSQGGMGHALAMALCGVVLLAARAARVGAARYVGPPEGAAFRPREPRCESCGYGLVGLPLDTNCPECGTPVADSMPGGRRGPTAWHRHAFDPRGWLALIRVHREVISGSDFFRRLPVRSGLLAARRFWWMSMLTMVGVVSVALAASYAVVEHLRLNLLFTVAAVCIVVLPWIVQTVLMPIAGIVGQFRYGVDDYRITAIVCYFLTPLLWPVLLYLTLLSIYVLAAFGMMRDLPAQIDDIWANPGAASLALRVLVLVGLALLVACLWMWWRQFGNAMRAVRFANS